MKRALFAAIGLFLLSVVSARAQDAIRVPNDASTGTTIGNLAKYTTANPSAAIITATGDVDDILGVVTGWDASSGTTGNAIIAQLGTVNCVFDAGGATAGHYVVNSSATAGRCKDGGASRPTGNKVIGRVIANVATNTAGTIELELGFTNAAGGGSFANPSATASDTAVNGSATTAMRSDAAPAVQKGTNAAFGVVRGDTSTINCVAGVCTAVGGAATTITPGTTTVSGATAPCLIDNSATTVMGCAAVGTGVLTALGNNLSAAGGLTTTIASGTSALGTSAISSAACATVVTTAATNTATTDVVTASFNGDPTAVTGYIPSASGMLTIISYPTANNVNFKVCNNTSGSVTPGAITLNWRVTR